MIKLFVCIACILAMVLVWMAVAGFYFDKRDKYEANERKFRESEQRSAWIKKYDLPPCKGVECYRCANIGYIADGCGNVYILGCAKGRSPCEDFSAKEIDPATLADIKLNLKKHQLLNFCDNGLKQV